jgi:hypothetical protein
MSLFLTLGTALAQNYNLTENRLSSDELNAKTASTLVAIKNLSATNHFYFVGNTGAAPYSAAEFSDAAVFVWQPVNEGEAGSYYLMKLDGTYMQATSPADFGTVDGAAVFTTANPTVENGGFNGDSDSQQYIDDQAMLVRFVNANDNSCEGIVYEELHAISTQFQPEACSIGNPENPLYKKFFTMMEEVK